MAFHDRTSATVTVLWISSLAVQIDRFLAELELRLGAEGDQQRFRQAVDAARAASTHPTMAAWLDELDRLEPRAKVLWS